ncbi:MAG: hypothetical protein KDB18_11390 [Salinibacterium sp.]|nr:hypothetical protein [Salinibacterium sp.]
MNAPTPDLLSLNSMDAAVNRWTAEAAGDLLARHFNGRCALLADLGFSGDLAVGLKWKVGAERLEVLHPDADRLAQLRRDNASAPVDTWRSCEPLALSLLESKVDLLIMADVLHEIYSEAGRVGFDPGGGIHHELALAHVQRVLQEAVGALTPDGALLIATDVLPSRVGTCRFEPRHRHDDSFVNSATAMLRAEELGLKPGFGLEYEAPQDALAVLLAEFDQPTPGMIRPFLSLEDWRTMLHDIGLELRLIVGTPAEVQHAREANFSLEPALWPEKRAVIFALRRG